MQSEILCFWAQLPQNLAMSLLCLVFISVFLEERYFDITLRTVGLKLSQSLKLSLESQPPDPECITEWEVLSGANGDTHDCDELHTPEDAAQKPCKAFSESNVCPLQHDFKDQTLRRVTQDRLNDAGLV